MITLFVIGFNRPDLLWHQDRLLEKHLQDEYHLCVIDNTPNNVHAAAMQHTAMGVGAEYLLSPSQKHDHAEALNYAAALARERRYDFFGFLDHDVFPRRQTTLVDKLEKVGFHGIGQTHPPTGRRYLWPGFCFFSRSWLNDRPLNFLGIRGEVRADDGDTGSSNWPLFSDADWRDMFGMEHGYVALRQPDNCGLQSWGYEILGDFIHFTNASHWMEIPAPQERDRLMVDLLGTL